ncbi:hypothetical protein [Polynucleobacter sp. UK-Kesae-W10]|uniref:hypothetical protein n=1 Tax=Polynucleobacter sp. UK-Kesae-W10 TaxID=1819738 RepID=UPI001C0AE5D8|nr:hypothetical protein [Polynucleobacter sp. UK-Kesae-W10]MBU3577522.1 hypothetical protein [Polynucleobacter sp. UK-Kesae-W10]
MGKMYDLSGQIFGRLTALRRGERDKFGRPLWVCECACGNQVSVTTASLTGGSRKSCGCGRGLAFAAYVESKKKNAKYKPHARTRGIWKKMISRCHNPEDASYLWYGARGIFVSESWHLWENFLADMGDGPEGLSLDRIDNNAGYSKENCRWATPKEQSRNTRQNVWCQIDAPGHEGKNYVLTDAAEILGVSKGTLRSRLHAAIRDIGARYA